MKIDLKDMYHGAALTQIAEYKTFKAINSFEPAKGEKSRAAFSVNHDTGIYLKYGTNPTKAFKEYSFVFTKANFDELAALKAKYGQRVFVVLVCVKAKEICILTLKELEKKRAERESENGSVEPQYQLLVAVPKNKSFRVYMNAPGVKKTSLQQTVVSRSDFPRVILEGN